MAARNAFCGRGWVFVADVNMGVSKNRGTPKWMVYFMENPMNKWMIWGYHYFWKHPYRCSFCDFRVLCGTFFKIQVFFAIPQK